MKKKKKQKKPSNKPTHTVKKKKKKQPAEETGKKSRWELWFAIIFVLAVGIGYFWTQKHYFSESETVKAVITNTLMRKTGGYGNKILEVKYQYTIGGKTYTGTENTFHFELSVGDTIEVEVSKKHNDVSQLSL